MYNYTPAIPYPWKPFVPVNVADHAEKMNRQYELIQNICEKKAKNFARPPVAALPSEVKEEITLAKVHDDDQSIVDPETEVSMISPELARIIKPGSRRVKDDDGILTKAERKQLALEIAERRKKFWLALPLPQNPFAAALKA